jgi:hypothetical protein
MKTKKIVINFILGFLLIFTFSYNSHSRSKLFNVKSNVNLALVDDNLYFIFSKPQEITGIRVFLYDEFEKIKPEIQKCRKLGKLEMEINNKKINCVTFNGLDFNVWSINQSTANKSVEVGKIKYGEEIKELFTEIKAKKLKRNVKYGFEIFSPGYIPGRSTFIITEDNKLIYPADKINIPEKYSASDKK